MPIYEFECKHCHSKKEENRSMKDSNKPAVCPGCSKPMVRNISPCGVKFVGSGFYQTDYKDKESK